MDILLDTHAIIWFLEGETSLSENIRSAVQDTSTQKFVSIITFYDFAIKINIGKLKINKDIESYIADCRNNSIHILPVSEGHLTRYTKLPLKENHRDPFDRLLIATAIVEDLTIATTDKKFELYGDIVSVVW